MIINKLDVKTMDNENIQKQYQKDPICSEFTTFIYTYIGSRLTQQINKLTYQKYMVKKILRLQFRNRLMKML